MALTVAKMTVPSTSMALGSPIQIPQTPPIQNADLDVRPTSSGLKPAIKALVRQSTDPVWIAYSVPMIGGDSQMSEPRQGDLIGYERFRAIARATPADAVSTGSAALRCGRALLPGGFGP